ncbi:aldo/keto reductase [Streptomyces acidiscabies]|uniref:Aldo/keto reductase n=1 Tax=Streptomyces acidiscabies TaxID=42234 RepID=A0AAP6BDY0_9ACTN|nr:aldo/keto reductase [Streptomyces acidiscabies]MBP5941772.1 aldo/keto reductase [Streptomyces sp. LBUM 1476]MBZ3913192.1 aldo/keto reductase [Streptomyces acidiscabies]MDX2962888.1 aldo/keto reductase [Streptomyces acidiscabies]MDX3021399.1 aldo/keto reductase [Streptomyces acidiscabies]MDX3790157.1 aldo/keto reductase [Streptomyces acidiscabies]
MTARTTNTAGAANAFSIGGDYPVRRLGFGAMRLPTTPGPDREGSITLARHAVELGVTLIDTAHLYGWGANEELLAEALHPYPEDLLIATKVGVTRSGPDGWAHDARPESLRRQVEQGLRRLRTEHIGLLQLHRIDPNVPVAEQVGTLHSLQLEGKIGHIGLSEVSVAHLHEARQTAEIASVQNRFSLLDRYHEPVLEACEAAGIAFLPWRPVAAATDSRAASELTAVADSLGATVPQILLAWLLARSSVILPIPGTASRAHLEENLAAADLQLTDSHRQLLERAARSAAPTGGS